MDVSRRRLLGALGTGAAALVAGCAGGSSNPGTAARTTGPRTSTDTTTASTTERADEPDDGSAGPALWSFRDGESETEAEQDGCRNCAGVVARPTVDGDRLYVPGQNAYALARSDGTRQWRVETPPCHGTPVVRDGHAYVTAGFGYGMYAWKERLVAVGPDGRRRWTYEDEWRDDAYLPILAVDAERVYVCPRQDQTIDRNPVRAVDRETGDVAWTAEMPTAVAGNGAVVDGALVVATWSGITAVDAASGEPRWSRDGAAYRPTVADDLVVLNADDGIAALTPAGDVEWRYGDGTRYVLQGDTLYTAGADGTVSARNPRTGSERWRYGGDPAVLLAAVDAEGAYVVERDGPGLLRVADGELVWRRDVDGSLSFAADGGGLYGYDSARGTTTLLSLSPADGEVRWRFELEDAAPGPTVADGVAYLGTKSGAVHAFPPEKRE
ncbi:PQQ-binding-like beta-propeller repeat protein [Halostella litorea]|uniref:PQQ-binding-like beta-propeller repeat protein n=1 Tax=Halostella litorea TaxID=2528831 RepID=UPI0010926D11|nr:PQQ-binding-like beta-propeller repeat protein [Halostella litorea]